MRIFLCCQQSSRRHAVPAYAFWAHYFRNALAEAGHACLEAPGCDWAEGLLPLEGEIADGWRERTWDSALGFIRREHAREPIDFFLGYLFPGQILPAACDELRALGIPSVNFFCDNVREFRRVPGEFAAFDLHWVPEHQAIALYERAGLPFLHAPMPCWVPSAQRTPVDIETLPASFVGTRDELRERLFAEVIRLGCPVTLSGVGWVSPPPATPPPRASNPLTLARRQLAFARQHGWPALARKFTGTLGASLGESFDFSAHAKPPPSEDEYWRVLREAAVCLGVNRYPSLRFPLDRPDSYSRLRDIEAPMAGACYLTEWTPGLDHLYDLGVEIEFYRDAAELVEKATALANDEPRRKKLRVNGQRRALADHSIPRTIRRIADRLGISHQKSCGVS